MFFFFYQNNSGGSFIVNDETTLYMIIEADDADAANARAEDIGIYFDGVEKDIDCACCGDRWYRVHKGDEDLTPSIFECPVAEFSSWSSEVGQPYAHIYYADGRKETFLQREHAR